MLDHTSNYFKSLDKKKKCNRIDLYQYGYQIRLKSAKKLGKSKSGHIKDITDKLREELVHKHKETLSASFMNKEKREVLRQIIKEYLLNNEVVVAGIPAEKLLDIVCDNIIGFGVIQPLIDDESVTDIYINGNKDVVFEKIGKGEITFPYRFETEDDVKALAYKLVNSSKQTLNTGKPYVDCVFPYIRINIALDEIAGVGTTITIRKNAPYLRASEERMLSTNQASKPMLNFLEAAVKGKLNILIAGATGTGKTEFIKYLSSKIPTGERTLVVEDNPELYLHEIFPNKHFIPMNCRPSDFDENIIDLDVLLKNGLRQSIKRLIVGESRGKEALQMLNFFETGHAGFTSIHSRSARKAIKRLMLMCQQSGADINAEALYQLIAEAFDLIVFFEKKEDNNRYITELIEVMGYEKGDINFNSLFRFKKTAEEVNDEGKIVKIVGEHVIESSISAELNEKLQQSTVDVKLYENLIDSREVKSLA